MGYVHEIACEFNFLTEVRKGNYGHIADEQELGIVGVFNHADVAEHALGREESGLLVEDGTEEFVGGAEALHEDVAFTVMNDLHSLGYSLELYGIVDNLEFGGVNAPFHAHSLNEGLVSHESSLDETHVHCQGTCFDSVLIDSPCCHQSFADVFCL